LNDRYQDSSQFDRYIRPFRDCPDGGVFFADIGNPASRSGAGWPATVHVWCSGGRRAGRDRQYDPAAHDNGVDDIVQTPVERRCVVSGCGENACTAGARIRPVWSVLGRYETYAATAGRGPLVRDGAGHRVRPYRRVRRTAGRTCRRNSAVDGGGTNRSCRTQYGRVSGPVLRRAARRRGESA